MVIHYIVLAHKNPFQIKKLITALNNSKTWFYVHVDKKVDITPFNKRLKEIPNLTMVPDELREICNWGGIGILNATLAILQMITNSNKKGYAVLLSGQDYPIKSNTYIYNYFKKHEGNNFINYFPLPSSNWSHGGLNRLTHYKIDLSYKRADFILIPSIWSREFFTLMSIKKLLKLLFNKKGKHLSKILLKKNIPKNIKFYGGDTWWAITTKTCQMVLAYLNSHPEILKLMKSSNLSDEIIFQTIILDLYKENAHQIKNSVTYANWSGKDEPSPNELCLDDLPKIKSLSPNILFARKFDIEKCSDILYQVDEIRNC